MFSVKPWILVFVGFVLLIDGCRAAAAPKWTDHDLHGKGSVEYTLKKYSTRESPGATYNPNLPEDLRAQYKDKEWSNDVFQAFCQSPPDSGYFCNGAVGDLPPLHQRFYFDIFTQSCRCFLYNGCDGNENNFRSYEHCMQWCAPNMTLFEMRRTVGKGVYSFAKNSADCFFFY